MILNWFENSLQSYPLLYAIFVSVGIGWGAKAGLDKLISYYIVLKVNQEEIKKILKKQEENVNLKFNLLFDKMDLVFDCVRGEEKWSRDGKMNKHHG